MRAIVWKISTFSAAGLAAFLALHPVSPTVEKAGASATTTGHPASSNGLWGLFRGSSSTDTAGPHTGTHVQALRDARNATEECEALRALTTEAAGDEEAIGEIADHASVSHARPTRICAINALERIPTAAARSYLADLLNDGDTTIRDWALRALASKAQLDPDARSTMIDAAHSEDRSMRLAALVALGDAHVPEASALIQDAISHETGEMQSRLVNALGETHDPAAVSAITTMLDGSAHTRQAALEALGAIGGDAALKVLEDKLANGTRDDVFTAARALATTGDPNARQTLIAATQSPRREEQLAALGALSQVEGEAVRGVMVKGLHATDPQTVEIATGWFSAHGDRASVGELTALLKTAPMEARGSIVHTLAAIGGDDAREAIAVVARSSGPEQTAALTNLINMPGGRDEGRKIALGLAKGGGSPAYTALALLGRDGTAESRDALAALARAGGDIAPQAMSSLAEHGDPEAMRTLADLARTGKTPTLRGQALATLASSGDPKNTGLFTAAMHDKDVSVRRAAVSALGRVGGDVAERALVDATSDADRSTRSIAIQSLGALHTASSTTQLEKLTSSDDVSTARTAFQTLVGSSPERAATVADRMMATGNPDMRRAAVQNASQYPSETGNRILATALRDADPDVATTAVDSLASAGGSDAQQKLLDLLSAGYASTALKQAAANALDRSGSDMARSHSALIDKYKSDGPAIPEDNEDFVDGDEG
jgi:HEAT repeat protein